MDKSIFLEKGIAAIKEATDKDNQVKRSDSSVPNARIFRERLCDCLDSAKMLEPPTPTSSTHRAAPGLARGLSFTVGLFLFRLPSHKKVVCRYEILLSHICVLDFSKTLQQN